MLRAPRSGCGMWQWRLHKLVAPRQKPQAVAFGQGNYLCKHSAAGIVGLWPGPKRLAWSCRQKKIRQASD